MLRTSEQHARWLRRPGARGGVVVRHRNRMPKRGGQLATVDQRIKQQRWDTATMGAMSDDQHLGLAAEQLQGVRLQEVAAASSK